MLKRLKWFAIFIGIVFIITYIAMIISVLPVIHEAEAIFLNSSNNDSSPLQRYSTRRYGDNVNRKANIIPLFAFHNNHSGYIYVLYSYEVRDKANNLLSGSATTISKWEIAKETNYWSVKNIIEDP